MSIHHSTGCPISKKYTVNQGCMSMSTYLLDYGRHVARLRRRRRRAYAPTSNTASHDNHKKILHGFPFLSRDDYGAPLGGPSGRRSSAMSRICRNSTTAEYSPTVSSCTVHGNLFMVPVRYKYCIFNLPKSQVDTFLFPLSFISPEYLHMRGSTVVI